ncbi:MAG: hypothetical protein CSA11_02730 [Chloroflexi bacterium]|nr:MAG: hypothetical protein CSA11_02730 [Chloroflexota bacterium]
MSESRSILVHDLKILEAMVAELAAYLASDAPHWPLIGSGMPHLTIGGCLMRQERLQQLRTQLTFADQARLDRIIDEFNASLKNRVVRFEKRAYAELHACLREWTTYLQDATSKKVASCDHYAHVVDTRIIITALMSKLAQPPYQLNDHLVRDIAQMDNHLKGQWQTNEFVLDAVWKDAYDPVAFWWLYGCPKSYA